MFKLGLKKHLSPYKKLSEKHKYFQGEMFPEYDSELGNDEIFDWSFTKHLPYCEIRFYLRLENFEKKFFKEGGSLAKIRVYVVIESEFGLSRDEYWFEPDYINFKQIKSDIFQDLNFKEFHTYKLKLNSWNCLFDFSEKKFIAPYKVIAPTTVKQNENFNLVPVLLQYNNLKNRYTKRFDFGIVVFYSLDLMEEENPHEFSILNQIEYLILIGSKKETKFKIKPEVLGMETGYITYELLFSTIENGEIIREFDSDLINIKLGFKWEEMGDYLIKEPKMDEIRKVYEVYRDLSNNQEREIKRYKEIKFKKLY